MCNKLKTTMLSIEIELALKISPWKWDYQQSLKKKEVWIKENEKARVLI